MGDLFLVLRRRWLLVVISALIVPVVAVAMSGRTGTVHSASATVLLVDGLPDEVARILPVGVSKHSDRDFAVRSETARSEEVAAVAAEAIDSDAETIFDGISVSADVSDNTIEFSYVHEDAGFATDAVNAYADAYVEVSRRTQEERLQTAIDSAYAIAEETAEKVTFIPVPEDVDARFVSDLTLGDGAYEGMLLLANRMALSASVQEDPAIVVAYAELSSDSLGESVAKTAAIALIGGLVLGIMLALLAEYMDKRRETQVS